MKTECIGDHVKLKGKTYPCTVSLTMDLVGGKWKAVILYHLKNEAKRYSELRKELATVTEMTLSLQLKQLEKDGLVSRKVFGKKPPIKVVYSLTDLGKTFIPVLEVITEWGNRVVIENGEFINVPEKESN
ncbi:winged helix-turn-helix transcriptional regulator [Chryseobacterium lathyri]|jgi:DNA-binding HxlR family transcriptional regulator|uniref:DNA-binding HxlR family transcriptional regulator n=1 Tax=Chryseobacterium lathyri TaxID=395933 RepID=A0ABT9SL28_9FLAO|nr:helix-turn-helix domain-containing protein [Chryseobacterium lathyri]MDP9960128.1 DNA-binding HxlR family transcriptional regulator [Chryseobacterium lathyri]MDQ0067631.1 DNA-binding HxlR family transcriptional regulator [Chryseobacterium lathyri]